MTILVIGGAASGKSELAEEITLSLNADARIYVATMQAYDEEGKERVRRHRQARAHKGFATVECDVGLNAARVAQGSAVLLEDVTNLVANEMFSPQGAGRDAADAALRGVRSLVRQARHVVAVSGDVFRGGGAYAQGTAAYVENLARVNRGLARDFDIVLEAVCGLAAPVKGKLP